MSFFLFSMIILIQVYQTQQAPVANSVQQLQSNSTATHCDEHVRLPSEAEKTLSDGKTLLELEVYAD